MDPHSFIARAEAQRWLGIAEKLLISHDLVGSKTFAIRARESDPRLEAADQILAIADTLLAAEKRVVGNNGSHQPDYYAILQLVRFVQDTDHIAQQYRRLAVALNPHQNRFPYADQAFQLVNDAWAVLSNPMRKSMYDSDLDYTPQQQMNTLGFNIEQQHHQQQQAHNFFSINQELPEQSHQQTFQSRLHQSHQHQQQQLQQHNFLSQANPVRPMPVREQEHMFQHREQEQLFQVTSPPHQQTQLSPQGSQSQGHIQSPSATSQGVFSWPQVSQMTQQQFQHQQIKQEHQHQQQVKQEHHIKQEQHLHQQIKQEQQLKQQQMQQEQLRQQQLQEEQRKQQQLQEKQRKQQQMQLEQLRQQQEQRQQQSRMEKQQRLLEEQRKQQQVLEEQRKQQQLLEEQRKQQQLLEEQRKQQQLLEEQRKQQLLEEQRKQQQLLEEQRKQQQLEEQRKQQLLEEQRKQQQLEEEQRKQQQLLEEQRKQQQLLEEQRKQQQLLEEKRKQQQLEEERQKQQQLEEELKKQQQLQEEQRKQQQLQEEQRKQQQLQEEQRKQHEQRQESVKHSAAPVQVNNNNGVRVEETETEAEMEAVDDSPTFWTACPYCFYMYEYPRVYVECTLRCDNCKRAFQAVRISSPPQIIEGQDAYFYCWGFIPVGLSMSHLQNNNNMGRNSSWTPFSSLHNASNNFQNHLNEQAAPKENPFVNKSSGPRIYLDEITEDVFIGASEPSSDSHTEWVSTTKQKSKRMDKGFKERIQVLALRAIYTGNGSVKNLKHGIPVQKHVEVPLVLVVEAGKKNARSNPRKQSGRVAQELGKLDLNVEFNNNEGEETASWKTAGVRAHKQGEEGNIEGNEFFEGLDEYLSSLPILSAVNEEKVKVA